MASAVTPVILGLLSGAPRSGYEMKAIVDRSTRYFWAASYGQIYPELRRLEEEGLVEGEDAPNGGRPRRRYRLTAAGRESLREWLLADDTRIDVRDESLLRLFFADALSHAQALTLLDDRRKGFAAFVATLREMDSWPGKDPPFVDLLLQYGIAYGEWEVQWCTEQLRRLSVETATEKG